MSRSLSAALGRSMAAFPAARSTAIVNALDQIWHDNQRLLYGVPINARNILEDLELKNAIKTYSNWPTFPQIFIKGEFVGGSDIILKMHQNGELKEKLKDVIGGSEEAE